MSLSAIHLFMWFYSFSLNRLSLICFYNWKKKICLKNTDQPDPTHPFSPILQEDTTPREVLHLRRVSYYLHTFHFINFILLLLLLHLFSSNSYPHRSNTHPFVVHDTFHLRLEEKKEDEYDYSNLLRI